MNHLEAQRTAVHLTKSIASHRAVIAHHARQVETLSTHLRRLPLTDSARQAIEELLDGQEPALLHELDCDAAG